MKLTKEEFKDLQEFWYRKAKESGFKDIESLKDKDTFLKESCIHVFRNACEIIISTKQEYFTLITHFVEDPKTDFKHPSHRHIMRRYADGTKIKHIVEELQGLGLDRDRKNVRLIIRRYVQLWKIFCKK